MFLEHLVIFPKRAKIFYSFTILVLVSRINNSMIMVAFI